MPPSGAGLGDVHFLRYVFVLDIYCQQLGYIVQMEGVCAPFGRGVGKCAFFSESLFKRCITALEEKNYVDHSHKQSHNITDGYCDLGPCCKPCDPRIYDSSIDVTTVHVGRSTN